ncbi:hypothetical protein D3C72_2541170 [compost metagenome]
MPWIGGITVPVIFTISCRGVYNAQGVPPGQLSLEKVMPSDTFSYLRVIDRLPSALFTATYRFPLQM